MIKTNLLNKLYNLNDQVDLTPEVLRSYVKSFWHDVFMPLHSSNSNIHLNLMCKVGYGDSNVGSEFKTIAELRKVNFDDRDIFTTYLLDRLGILTDSYDIKTCNSITFTYIVKDGLADATRQLVNQTEYTVTSHKYNNIKLPLTMNPSEYGVIIGKLDIDNGVQYVVKSDSRIYTIESYATR